MAKKTVATLQTGEGRTARLSKLSSLRKQVPTYLKKRWCLTML